MASEGELLNDRYRLDDRIAAGGMGEVWRANDTLLGRSVAVKLLHDGRAGDREFQARFHHEARAMAALRHPGIATVYDYGESGDGSAYIVMAFIDGRPLDRCIAEDGRFDPATTTSIVAQAARALGAAHAAGIVHRDVKPGNLIVRSDGTVVLVDFGVARSAALASVTATNDVVGTALYIAPEQVSKQDIGPATDVYALGAVAYHCVAGRPPFAGDDPIAIALHHLNDEPPPLPADVPEPVTRLITTAMSKQPSHRYPSAAAMAEAASSAGAGIGAPAGSPTEELGPPAARRRPMVPWLLALLAVATIAIGAAVWLGTSDSALPGPGPSPTGIAPAGAGVGTAPEGGGTRATGTPGRTAGPSAARTEGDNAGPGNATTTTPAGGGVATPTDDGGGATADPEPTPTAGDETTPQPVAGTGG